MKYQEAFPVPMEWVSETAALLSDSVARWADTEVMPARTKHREQWGALLEPALGRLLDDVGLRQLVLCDDGPATPSEELGVTLALALEQVGRADTGLAVVLASTLALHVAAHRSGGSEAEETIRSAGGLGIGSLVLPAYGEPSPGLSGLHAQVAAVRRADAWVLDGADVRPQCASADAAFFGVVCDLGDEPGLLLVPADAPGITRHEPILKTGLAASRNGDVTFDGVVVPGSHVLVRGGASCAALTAWYELGCAAAAVGAEIAAWEILRDWGDNRVIKGKGHLLRDNPLAAALMGEIGAGVATSRLLMVDLATLLGSPESFAEGGAGSASVTATAVVRAVTRTAMEGLDAALELMGSAGYATEWNIERYWRDIKTLRTYLGPETHAQVTMSRHYFGSEPALAEGTDQ